MNKTVFISFWRISQHILFQTSPDVLFYYPQHFNRSTRGSNPFFDPILLICKQSNIRYLVLEEPDSNTQSPRNKDAVPADILFWLITILRKCLRTLQPNTPDYQRDITIGKFLNLITFSKFRCSNYITISNSMSDILAGLNPNGKVYDLQHGIIYANHPGYFDKNGLLRLSLRPSNKRFLIWGELFQKSFTWNLNNNIWMHNKLQVIGYPIPNQENYDLKYNNRKIILYSLQFTHDFNITQLQDLKDMLDESLKLWTNSQYQILLKHHPRFNNAIDISSTLKKYPFVSVTNLPLNELISQVRLHITFSSTTCFEYAQYGIPTYFLNDNRYNLAQRIFYTQYKYPLYNKLSLSSVIKKIADTKSYIRDCEIVKTWYASAFAPFNTEKILSLLYSHDKKEKKQKNKNIFRRIYKYH